MIYIFFPVNYTCNKSTINLKYTFDRETDNSELEKAVTRLKGAKQNALVTEGRSSAISGRIK